MPYDPTSSDSEKAQRDAVVDKLEQAYRQRKHVLNNGHRWEPPVLEVPEVLLSHIAELEADLASWPEPVEAEAEPEPPIEVPHPLTLPYAYAEVDAEITFDDLVKVVGITEASELERQLRYVSRKAGDVATRLNAALDKARARKHCGR